MAFGHRIYKNYDPRAKIIRWSAEQVFEVTGHNSQLNRARAGANRSRRRIFREAETVSERRFVLGDDVSGHGFPGLKMLPCCSRFRGLRVGSRSGRVDEDPEQTDHTSATNVHGVGEREFVPIDKRVPVPIPAEVSNEIVSRFAKMPRRDAGLFHFVFHAAWSRVFSTSRPFLGAERIIRPKTEA